MPICEYCRPNKQFASENDLHEHISAVHPFRCTLCPDSVDFGSHYTWINHYGGQHKSRCPYCDAIVGDNTLAKRNHFTQVHDYHPCTQCSHCFESADELTEHYRYAGAQSHPYICNKCNKTLANNHDFWYHAFEEYATAHCCPLCQQHVPNEFNDKVQWTEHLKIAHRMVSCSRCFEVFANEHECKAHYKDQHRSTCAICHDDFPDEDARATHHNAHHQHTCAHCPSASFATHALKTLHHNTVHRTTCATCAAHFDTALEFEHHYNDTHRSQCDQCARSFATDERLRAHVERAHTRNCATECGGELLRDVGRSGHVCTDCGEVCANERDLVAHYKGKHVRQWDVSPPAHPKCRRSSANH